jgi:predicted acetyltransferase
MTEDSEFYLLKIEDKEIGYTIINSENILIEFYVENMYISSSNRIFKQVLKHLSVTEIYCKSFDHLLLSNCVLSLFKYSVVGVLYRDYFEPLVVLDSGINMIKANLSSIELLKNQDDSIAELFETEDQLTKFIKHENVFEFYKNDEFIGCGMVIRTHLDWDFCDLGVWVNPSKRGKSIGSQILLNLREFAINNSLKPSCGCAIENVASQKTIEKSGFVSRYTMINFKTK